MNAFVSLFPDTDRYTVDRVTGDNIMHWGMSFQRMAHIRLFITPLLVLVFFWLLFWRAGGATTEAPESGVRKLSFRRPLVRVLHLNSYHQGLQWSDGITAGIRHALLQSTAQNSEKIDLTVEYMDTKRYLSDTYFDILRHVYTYKYGESQNKRVRVDLVISSDDNAYRFLLRRKDELFPGIPWVFCGVNHFRDADLEGRTDASGVVEVLDRKDTIDLARILFPKTENVLIVTDNTVSGKGNRKILEEMAADYGKRAAFIFLDDDGTGLDLDELIAKVNAAPQNSVIYYSDFFKDRHGDFLEIDTVMRRLSTETRLPIFTTGGDYIGRGAFGGRLVDGFRQGEIAGRIAARILEGASTGEPAVIKESVNQYIFDYRQLKRFGVPMAALPEEAVVTHLPPPAYAQYRRLLPALAVFAGLLSMMTLLSFAYAVVQKRAGLKIRESEERFRALAEHAPVAISIIRDGRYAYVNPAWETLTGYDREEAARIDPLTTVQPAMRETVRRRSVSRLKGEDAPSRYEIALLTKDGREKWIDFVAALIDYDGGPAILNFNIDITEKRRVEAELRFNEERLRYILKHDPNAIAVFDDALRYIAVSDRYMADYHIKVENIIGMHHYEVFPEMPQRWRDVHRRVLAGAVEKNDDDYFVRPDGALTYNRWECRPWYTGNGEIGGIITYTEVTTDRKLAEIALQESEARAREQLSELTQLYDNSPVGLALFDTDFRFVRINQALAEINGGKVGDFIGKRLRDVVPTLADETESIFREIMRSLRERTNVEVKGETRAAPGVERHWIANYYPVAESRGRPKSRPKSNPKSKLIGIGAIVQEVTELKRAEREREMMEARLLQQQKLESIGTLAGGVAHDINNMLSPIIGYAELLSETDAGQPNSENAARKIISAAMKARDLVQQLLAFGRKQALEMRVLDLNDVVSGLMGLIRRTIREDIDIRISLAPGLPAIRADAGQVEQVFMNLVVNAQDAMPRGGRMVIETGAQRLDPHCFPDGCDVAAGEYVVLVINDTGEGMVPEVRDRIFEPFFTTKDKGKGTGLGLSTSYGIVKQHGGHIWVYSEAGVGTTFKVYFPALEAPVEFHPEEAQASEEVGGGETVVVVEDNPDVGEMVVAILEKYGYRVTMTSNGHECLEWMARHLDETDLVITDMVMPDINGKELAQRLRADRPDIRVLFMSGYSDVMISQEGGLEEGVDFIQKPFSVQKFAGKVREILDRR